MADRVGRFVEGLGEPAKDETLLIVAHGGPLQVMICRLLGIGLEHWWQFHLGGASVSILETYPQGTSVALLNGTSHLK